MLTVSLLLLFLKILTVLTHVEVGSSPMEPDFDLFARVGRRGGARQVIRMLADPGIVRDGSGTTFLGPTGRFRAPGAFEGHLDAPPKIQNIYIFIGAQTVEISQRGRNFAKTQGPDLSYHLP